MVNTEAKAYIFPGDSPMIREDVGWQEQKWLQRQKTDCRPATVNLGQTQIERMYRSFLRVHMRKREEGGSTLNKQGNLGRNKTHSLPEIPPEHPCRLLNLKTCYCN